MEFLIGGLIGFVVGAAVIWASQANKLTPYNLLGSISIDNVECFDGDTMIRVAFTTLGGTPVEVRALTYDSSGAEPGYADAMPVNPTSPIEMSYNPASCQDRVIVHAAFASSPATRDVPCVGSGCSSSGSGVAGSEPSVLP